MDVAIVGAGRVGTAIAVMLGRAGHRIVAASGRDASRERVARYLPDVPYLGMVEAATRGAVVVLGVPDDGIRETAQALVDGGAVRREQAALHLSGSASLEELAPAREAGATVLSVHPLQSLPDVETAIARLPGSAVAVTADEESGYALGERVARDLGGRPLRLPDDRKPLYHAGAVFASNYLVAAVATAERILHRVGLEEPRAALAPLARATLDRALDRGPDEALTGPVARGDAGTVRRNLEALGDEAPDAVAAYVALAAVAADIAERTGALDPAARRRVEEVLSGWR